MTSKNFQELVEEAAREGAEKLQQKKRPKGPGRVNCAAEVSAALANGLNGAELYRVVLQKYNVQIDINDDQLMQLVNYLPRIRVAVQSATKSNTTDEENGD